MVEEVVHLTNDKDHAILAMDSEKLDELLSEFVEHYEKNRIIIPMGSSGIGIAMYPDIEKEFQDKFHLTEKDLGELTEDITFLIWALVVDKEEKILERYGKTEKMMKILEIFKKRLQNRLIECLGGSFSLFELSHGGDLLDQKHISEVHIVSMKIFWFDQKLNIPRSSFYITEKKSELLKLLNALQSYFDDPEERHMQYYRFKEKLKEMKDIGSKYWDLTRLIIGCIDAAINTQAEDLTLSQVKAFKRVIEEIAEDIDCSKVNSLLGVLISENLKPVPNLQNLEPVTV